jgi:serine/threonine-protein kinase RsbW
MKIGELHLALRADPHEISRFSSTLKSFAADCRLPDDALFKIQLAIDELMNNILEHGYPAGSPGEIEIWVTRYGDRVEVEMLDDAVLFDPFSIKAPDLQAGIEDRPLGGLGVHLVKSLMSMYSYSVEGGRNRVHLSLVQKD